MRALKRLSEREEDKLRVLGQQRQELTDNMTQMRQQLEMLRNISQEYLVSTSVNALMWQNQRQLCHQLQPMDKTLQQRLGLMAMEKQRLDELWRAQFGKLQGLKWLIEKKQRTLIDEQARREQKACDDLAGQRFTMSA